MVDYEKRFGTIAVEKGFITLDQLVRAINVQVVNNIEKKEHKLIGTILYEQGLLTNGQIDEVLSALGRSNRKSEIKYEADARRPKALGGS